MTAVSPEPVKSALEWLKKAKDENVFGGTEADRFSVTALQLAALILSERKAAAEAMRERAARIAEKRFSYSSADAIRALPVEGDGTT